MVSKDFFVRSFSKEGEQTLEKSIVESCQYQGHVEGHPFSTVVLDMCDGLSGIIEDDWETLSIVPIKSKGFNAHKITREGRWNTLDAAMQNFSCGTKPRKSHSDFKPEVGIKGKRERPRRSLAIDPLFRKYIPVKKTRYTELIMIADKALCDKYGSNKTEVEQRVFRLVNAVDMIYQKINIRIILKGVELWLHNDSVPNNTKAGIDLENVQAYKQLHKDRYKCDTLHLLRGNGWDDHGGMAYLGGMCRETSTGVIGWNEWSNLGPWLGFAHEMGHNFGFDHDDVKLCKCLTPRGCIMRTFKTRIPGFSDCNLKSLNSIDDSCLYNVPLESKNTYCGDGIKEENEECDCGTAENCAILDPCCNPNTCRLHPSSMCSNYNDKCCKNCQFAQTGMVCRPAKDECDVPEFCTGKSSQCPKDDYKRNGRACNFTDDFIFVGKDMNDLIMARLPTRIKARYVRINPQHWKQGICMKAEIYGCDEVNLSANTVTSIRSDYEPKLYVEAKGSNCDPNQASELVFKKTDNYTVIDSMQFRLTDDGVLIHHCTGNRVCPNNTVVRYNTKLVINKHCSVESAKFTRIGKFLKHKKSGFCVHPFEGYARDGLSLILWPSCHEDRIALTFSKRDCEIALGMASGGISNNRINSSSYRIDKEPFHARLFGSNAWCPSITNTNQYLQIDFGKVRFISAVATQGTVDGQSVTGFKLYYSKNRRRWKAYTRRKNPSFCFNGRCTATRDRQCRDLWDPSSSSAPKACYHAFDAKNTLYGTCHAGGNKACLRKHALCGQLQCFTEKKQKPAVDYGDSYKNTLSPGMNCSLAKRKTTFPDTLGMVQNGTVCGRNKICINYKCVPIRSLRRPSCPREYGLECSGNGFCTALGKCHCYDDYDPQTNCSTVPFDDVDGNWSPWSSWSDCSRVCDTGTQRRYRLCNNPLRSQYGLECLGEKIEKRDCNSNSCPVAYSCRRLQAIGRETGVFYPSGVYTINPGGKITKTFCDMSRDGGGWTLLVSSHTNTWRNYNVRRRVERNLSLPTGQDFSILFAANDIKSNINIRGNSFEYRIEAQEFGRWGGIWMAPRFYSFTSTNNNQTVVTLIKKFDKWIYEDYGIEKRMPWIHEAMLTTSSNATSVAFGSIISNIEKFYPAPWINAKEQEQHPTNIWYWMREGERRDPRSCMELQLMALDKLTPLSSGVYTLRLRNKKIKTHCDLSTDGGGWTLLVTSASRSGWTRKNLRQRNDRLPSLNRDFSILGFSDEIIGKRHFQYRIEDETSTWGGTIEAEGGQSFLTGSSKQTRVKLLFKRGDWKTSNLAQRVPYTKDSTLLLTTAEIPGDSSGTLVSSSRKGIYLSNKMERPSALRIWVREGTWRSCNEIKRNLKLLEKQRSIEDGRYMIKKTPYQYLPVICDMKSDDGAWTLLVTSRNNGWLPSQVKARNTHLPSLAQDYSILELGDQIKDLSGGSTFMYKLEAFERGHWGGVWKAPKQYSFVATTNEQTNVSLVTKYDKWTYNWRNSLERRMPWLGYTKGLLTTSTHCDYSEWGTIISDHKIYNGAWIESRMQNPGVIWYWVNEDDCGPNKTQVDGGFSPWSAWSDSCETGFETRTRSCTNPAPQCGGRACNMAELVYEKRRCKYCPRSPIRSNGGFCLQPKTSDCSPTEGTEMIYAGTGGDDNVQCSLPYMLFTLKSGVLKHNCSGMYVCPQYTPFGNGVSVVLKRKCSTSTEFIRTRMGSLRYGSSFCVHPQSGTPKSGTKAVLWNQCDLDRLKLNFYDLNEKRGCPVK